MRRLIVVAGVLAALFVMSGPAHAMSAGVDPSGDYGTTPCYASVEYFKVTASVQPVAPYADVETQGNVGAHVVCPIPELDPQIAVAPVVKDPTEVVSIENMIITH